jgi:hypothetical protein
LDARTKNRKHHNHRFANAEQCSAFAAEERHIMSRRKHGDYIGGHTVIRDSDWYRRVAHRIRMTKKHNERARQDKERFAAEMEAYRRSGGVLRRK